jgi:predicted alpha/beta-fold hydrolase
MDSRLIQTDPDTKVLVQTQKPLSNSLAHVVLLHGLEGGGDAGYVVSMAWDALQSGFIAHRFHMRTCGGTQAHCKTLYHGGLTSDARTFLELTRRESDLPIFLIGFSLGGNIGLKLAGELGETDLIQGICAISTPIDLAMGVRRMNKLDNILYERRFLKRMRKRLRATGRYSAKQLNSARSLYEIDDVITAPSFGFKGADHYYATQSSNNFLASIRVPTLLIQAKDDTFVPFEMYSHPAITSNPFIHLLFTEHGGHLGFLSRKGRRFWLDDAALGFVKSLLAREQVPGAAR